MVFDTTAKNSGKVKGAAKVLEVLLDTKLLYIGCGHHVLELFLQAAWTSLFGERKSKDNPDCKEFQESWKELDVSLGSAILPEMTDEISLRMKESSTEILTSILEDPDSRSKLPRDDYRECAELALLMLGVKPKRWDKLRWNKPGAFHHARWMHLLLYAPKKLAFHAQCDWMSEEFVSQLIRFVR